MKRMTLFLPAMLLVACATEATPEPTTGQRVAHDVVDLEAADPALYDFVRSLEPRVTRAGHLRFTNTKLRDPNVAPILIDRLTNGNESPQVRAAIVEALPRTGGQYGDPVLDLLVDEQDSGVRVAMIASLRRAEVTAAVSGLDLGLRDAEPSVRAEAARVIGARGDTPTLLPALRAVLADTEPSVRAEAARSLGVLADHESRDALTQQADDADPIARKHAYRALDRLDANL